MKIVVVASRFPYPTEKGDKLRMYHHLMQLSKNHSIILIALCDGQIPDHAQKKVQALCTKIHLVYLSKFKGVVNAVCGWLNGLPVQVAYFYNRIIKEQIHALILQEGPDVVYTQLIRTALYTRNLPYYKVIDYMDCFSLLAQRRALYTSGLHRWFWTMESKRVAALEKDVMYDFEQGIIISDFDRRQMPVNKPQKISVVRNGVDTTYFHPDHEREKTYDLVITGNMGYRPNVQAAKILIEQIIPVLRTNKLLVAGARPVRYLTRNKNPRVFVSGWMEDIREAYWSAEIFVAPIFEGAGIQNKVLEAMACGLPCVISTMVNNGIGAEPEKEILVADDVPTMISWIKRLEEDQKFRQDLGSRARTFVIMNFGWDQQYEALKKVIDHDNN